MKEFFKHNRIAAAAALLLIIIVSLTAGVNRSVGKLADDLETAYAANDPVYGSAQKDAERFTAYLREFYSVAAGFGITQPDNVRGLGSTVSSPFSGKDSIDTAYAEADAVYNRVINTPGLTENASTEMIRSFAELQAMHLRLKNNKNYNTAAKEYNRVLSSFPANVFDFVHSEAAVFD